MGAKKRASALTSDVGPVAREECMAAGSDQITDTGGSMKITRVLDGYYAPHEAASVYKGAARFLLFKRTIQTTGEYLVRLDLLRRKAESKRLKLVALIRQLLRRFYVCRMLPFPGLTNRRGCWEFLLWPDRYVDFLDLVGAQLDKILWRRRMWT